MIKFFRKIRQKLIEQKKVQNYFLYAIGEIVLVVIGILIALQINNNNESNKLRKQELKYLKNIKTDLIINIKELKSFINIRTESIKNAQTIIAHFEGKPILDYDEFNLLGTQIYNWQKFTSNNNTFQELLNSGNLAIISNDSIKNTLLNIDALYKKLKSEEEHYRFDTEELIYKPLYETMDLNPLVRNYLYTISSDKKGEKPIVDAKYFEEYLKQTKLKNGFLMTTLEFSVMNEQMQGMLDMSEQLILLIDKEK